MHHRFIILFSSILLCISCNPGPRPEDAVQFNDIIVMKQDTFYMYLEECITLMENEAPPKTVHKQFINVLSYTHKTIDFFESHPPFDQTDEIRMAAIKFFSTQFSLLETEMKTIITLYSLPPSEISINDENKWDSIMTLIMFKDSTASNSFLIQQQKFSERYGITLREID